MSFFNSSGDVNITTITEKAITVKKFVATANQSVFTPVGSVGILARVIVGGVEQFSPEGFTVGVNGSFTLSVGVIAGTDVVAIYSEI